MARISPVTAVLTMIALVFMSSLPALAATGATIVGTVEVPCDPSRVSEVLSVQVRPVSGGPATTVAVDPSTGKFAGPALPEGEYDFLVLGLDGKPLSGTKRLQLRSGPNRVVLSVEPPGCGEQATSRSGGGLKKWHITLIYFGVVGALAFALHEDADDDPVSPSEP